MALAQIGKCKDCGFGKPLVTNGQVQCRRYPPTVIEMSGGADSVFPLLYPDDGCGEFLQASALDTWNNLQPKPSDATRLLTDKEFEQARDKEKRPMEGKNAIVRLDSGELYDVLNGVIVKEDGESGDVQIPDRFKIGAVVRKAMSSIDEKEIAAANLHYQRMKQVANQVGHAVYDVATDGMVYPDNNKEQTPR